MSETIQVDQELDCRGLSCPLPIVKTKKAIDGMAVGQILKMTATDPGSVNDMAAWVRKTGNDIVDQTEAGGEYTYFIRKAG
ncbi:MAG: sulfurtransferase TusA family protein [Leptospirillia bacterium]